MRQQLVVDMTSPSGAAYVGWGKCLEEMGKFTRLYMSWNTPDMSMKSTKVPTAFRCKCWQANQEGRVGGRG